MALNLITDRNANDVDYAESFRGKKWADLSTEEKANYLLGLKGAYSYTDFNRVENAVKYLSEIMNAYGYTNTVVTKTNWTALDMQKVSEIQRYINNVAELKNKYYSNVSGTMPTANTWLTTEGANYIEKILADIENILMSMEQIFVYSGVSNAGQGRMWQNRFRRKYIPAINYVLWNEIGEVYWNEYAETDIWKRVKEG